MVREAQSYDDAQSSTLGSGTMGSATLDSATLGSGTLGSGTVGSGTMGSTLGSGTITTDHHHQNEANTDYVILDERGEEVKSVESSIVEPERRRRDLKAWGYVVVILLFSLGAIYGFQYVIRRDDILALRLMFFIFLLQLANGINKKRPFGLPIMKFLAGRGVNAVVEESYETKKEGYFCCNGRNKFETTYVIKYEIEDEMNPGHTMCIQKTLKPDVFVFETGQNAAKEIARDIGIVTRIQVAKGYPYSGHPRRSLLVRYESLRIWNLYSMPLLVLTIVGVILSLTFSLSSRNFNSEKHFDQVFNTLIFYGFLYPIVLGPISYWNYSWSEEILYGGIDLNEPADSTITGSMV